MNESWISYLYVIQYLNVGACIYSPTCMYVSKHSPAFIDSGWSLN